MKRDSGKLRIIGGYHRGRIIHFASAAGLRPTPNRVRETLFNWLSPYIEDSICLDLFAGSGALGLESASRGAVEVVFIDLDPNVTASLEKTIKQIGIQQTQVICKDAMSYLNDCKRKFDLVFLDPPFDAGLLKKTISLINEKSLIINNGWVYVEYSSQSKAPVMPENWNLHRSVKAGDVSACLYKIAQPK